MMKPRGRGWLAGLVGLGLLSSTIAAADPVTFDPVAELGGDAAAILRVCDREPQPIIPFPDVATNHTFCVDIAWMYETGITTGRADGTYGPSGSVTRGQMAAFMYRLAGSPDGPFDAPTFTDVPPTHPFATPIAWMATNKITLGRADGTFAPSAPVTRGQMSAFLLNMWTWEGLARFSAPGYAPPDPGFTDVPSSHIFFRTIAWLADSGITVGRADGIFAPSADVTRGQMAAFLHRYWGDSHILTKVLEFAPILAFDRAGRGFPMDAQVFFDGHMRRVDNATNHATTWSGEQPPVSATGWTTKRVTSNGDPYRLMVNDNRSILNHGDVPTYFVTYQDPTSGALRITYWFFYGFQEACNEWTVFGASSGAHMGDWEPLTVTTTADRSQVRWVTYGQHGGWYTLAATAGPTMIAGRPVPYVAKFAHGHYHEQFDGGAWVDTPYRCDYYKDARNPRDAIPTVAPAGGTDTDYWWTSTGPLLDLHKGQQPWMQADGIDSIYPPTGYRITGWNWGFPMRYCSWGTDPIFGQCLGHDWAYPIGTHPTIRDEMNWTQPPCSKEGCDRGIKTWPPS
jgi:hypothetical protein